MKHSDKKAVIAACRGEYGGFPLTSEERDVLNERYLSDGSVRMTHEGIAAKLGMPKGRVIAVNERAIIKLVSYAETKQEPEPPRPSEPVAISSGPNEDIYPHSRPWRPWYRTVNYNQFETLDIVLAAGLMARGYKFIEIRDPHFNGVKKRIVLEIPPEEVPMLLEEFMRQDFMVDASVYHGRLKALKDMLYHKYNNS